MQAYRNLCPDNEYRVYELDFDLPGISKGLTDQISNVVIAASGDANGRVFFMANLHRPDPKDPQGHAIDQMPFGFVFDNEVPLLSGALIQHGNWDKRTVYPPASAWQDVLAGDYQTFVDLSLVPAASAGSIYDLAGSTQEEAFSTLISRLSQKASEFVREKKAEKTDTAVSESVEDEIKSPDALEN